MAGEASSTEESERIGIFPDAASSVGAHRLAMLATAFLASEKIPVILSDNGRRGLTLETRERRRRQIEIFLRSGVLGCSALPMLTSKEARNFYFYKRYLPRKAARRIRAPLHLPCLQGPAPENFKQAGLLARLWATQKNRKQRP